MIQFGLQWPDGTDLLDIYFWMLKQTDAFIVSKGTTRAELYLLTHKILWPDDDQHRWFVLGLTRIVENQVTVLMGSASSAKTHTMSVHALITFFAHPTNSFGMISSTEKRSLEIKVWGRVKGLYNRAKERFPWLPGYVLDSMMAITSKDIDEENQTARELTSGIICIPCISGGKFVGMSKYQGAKPPHTPGKSDGLLTHYGDEAAVMQHSFLDAYANWTVNGNSFKGVMGGNPTDISDPLCTAAEPEGGWDDFTDTEKTQEWKSKWYNAHVIAFDGRDTPNNDGEKKYPYLVSKEFVSSLAVTHGIDSWQYFQQGIGKPSKGMVSNRVITIGLCERHKAFDVAVWSGIGQIVDIYPIDPAFGGGDRCIAGRIRMGMNLEGIQILEVGKPEEVPISVNSRIEASEQIAAWVKNKCDALNIPPNQIFYDSLGSTQLGFAFSKVYGTNCPVPIESGGQATERPVRFDLYVTEFKNGTSTKRLKTCREQYSKLITEMWFSTREAIESEQIRSLQRIVAQEGQLRMYSIVAGNKMEVESKEDMKERVKKSPDLYDWFAIGVEGARRLGFKIQRIGANVETAHSKNNWLSDLKKKRDKLFGSKNLKAV